MNDKYELYLLMLQETIKRHGHAVQYVFGDPATGAPPYGYTVGLHETDGYELAVAGLDEDTTALVLRRLAEQLRRVGLQPAADLPVRDVIHGHPLKLRLVEHPEALGIIGALYDFNPPVWQGLWPDTQGRFPGDEGCAISAAGEQLF